MELRECAGLLLALIRGKSVVVLWRYSTVGMVSAKLISAQHQELTLTRRWGETGGSAGCGRLTSSMLEALLYSGEKCCQHQESSLEIGRSAAFFSYLNGEILPCYFEAITPWG